MISISVVSLQIFKSVLVWKHKERNKFIRKLSSFLGAKCFLFFIFIYKWLLQHNISYAISICIPSLSILDQSRDLQDGTYDEFFWKNCSRVWPMNYFRKKPHLRCFFEFEYHSANSKPLITFSENQAADLIAN